MNELIISINTSANQLSHQLVCHSVSQSKFRNWNLRLDRLKKCEIYDATA